MGTTPSNDSPPTAEELALARALRPLLALVAGRTAGPAERTYSTRDPIALAARAYRPKFFAELCRTGEIAARKVGRSWEATESAIVAYEARRTEASRDRRRAGQVARHDAAPANDVAAADRELLERIAHRGRR